MPSDTYKTVFFLSFSRVGKVQRLNIEDCITHVKHRTPPKLLSRLAKQRLRLECNQARRLPPGPKGWPVVGALPLVGSAPHVTLARMAKRYGPVMYLKMGAVGVVVASSPEAAKVFLKTLDVNFSNRPIDAGPTRLAYGGQDLVFAEYGPRWKLLRKLCNLHMLGTKALENWAHIRHNEMGHVIRTMLELSSKKKPVMLAELLNSAMANMIGEVILGERIFEETGTESEKFKDMVVELMTLAGLVNIGDYLPMLAWMDLQGIEGRMKKLQKKFDVMLTRMIKKHTATAENRKGKPDLLDVIMANRDNSHVERLSDNNVKAVLLNLFTAGTDTSSSTIEWAMSEMLKNPTILKRAQSEMDQVIGRNRRLTESDIPNLPYLRAICKESFRLHPSTPLNLPHVSSHACEVNGYYIPKNTKLLVNIWAIGRDPEVWKDPLEFNPERFLTGRASKMDPRGADFELIPFGAGRRICAGARMGVVLVEYILGVMIHSFDWENGYTNESEMMDMDEVFGLALQKKVPVSALVSPRLAPNVYA